MAPEEALGELLQVLFSVTSAATVFRSISGQKFSK